MPKSKPIGHLPPRYQFFLNPHADTRVSRCPLCERLTHPRKFALFILVDGWTGPLIMGKTGPYCVPCELIVTHQNDLESELALSFERLNPALLGNDYLVVGTVEKRYWKSGVTGHKTTLDEMLDRLADFKKYCHFKFDPGGWRPREAQP